MGASGDILSLGVDVSSNPDAAPQLDKITAAIAKFRAEAAQAKSADVGVQLAQDVNVAIGAFAKLGQTIDLTNARAVAGYAAIGEALRAQLVTLGATEAELNRIGASVIKVQQAAGAAGLGTFVPASFASNLNGTGFATRRAASAIAELSLAAQGGKVSFGALSVGAGAITADFAALAGTSLGLATGIGAVVTVGLALIGVLEGMGSKSKTAEQNLASLRDEAKKTASTDALRGQLAQQNKDLKDALAERQKLQGQQAAAGGPPVTDPTTGQIVSGAQSISSQNAIDALDDRIKKLQADQAATLNDLNKRGPEAIKSLADAERTLNEQTAVDTARRTDGEFAARRVAAENEFADEKKRLDDLALIKGQQTAAVAAAQRRLNEQLAAIDVDEAQKNAEAKLAAETKVSAAVRDNEVAAGKESFDKTTADLQSALNARAISQSQFIAQRLAAEKALNAATEQDNLKSIGRDQFRTQQAVAATPSGNADARTKLQGDLDALDKKAQKAKHDRQAADATADRAAAKETEALALELAKTVESANVAVLESQGQFVLAAQTQVQTEFRESIATAVAEIASGNLEGVNALAVLKSRIDQIVGSAGLKQVSAQHQDVQGDLQAQLRTIQAQQTEGALSQSAAEKQVVAAYQQAQIEISKLIEAQQALVAASPDNKQAAIDLANLNAEYIELGNTVSKLQDPFAQLKSAAEGATVDALGTLAQDATKIVSQSHVQVSALTAELGNAQTELNQLLAIPANQRTAAENDQILQLRGEVDNLSVSLGNAKLALTTWKSLFLDAAQSIVEALLKVSAQMLATKIIEDALGFLSFGGGGGGVEGEDLPLHNAAGGFIRGRGTPTSDSIPAMLSNGEFVVNAAATAQNRALLEHINGASLRRTPRHYAGGGLVSRGPSADALNGKLHVLIEHSPDSVVSILQRPEGEQAIVNVVQRNGGAVGAAIPPRRRR
jgi:hypothetical protein